MRSLMTLLTIAVMTAACHSPKKADNETAASVEEPATAPEMCADREVTDRLGRLHTLTLASDELPEHRMEKLRSILAGLDPAGSREIDDAYPGAARFTSSQLPAEPTNAIYHDPRFEGEERPHILHWRTESLGRADDWNDALRRLRPDDGVNLALWRETTQKEVSTLLVALREAGVDHVNVVGQQDIPSLAELDAPAEARQLYRTMHADDGNRVAARAMATFELERIIFEEHGLEPEIDPRMLEPTMSLAQRSRAYIAFLQREYHRAGCDMDPDHLVWLYRARFLREPPIAVRTLAVDSDVGGGATLQEILDETR